MNILIIGNIASGKTSISNAICQISKNFKLENYFSIDILRRKYSDGTFAGEFLAWSKMLEYMQYPIPEENSIFEFSGTGRNAWFVASVIKQTIEKYKTKWIVVYCSCNKKELLDRNKDRVYDIPLPYNLGTTESLIKYMSTTLSKSYDINYWNTKEMSISTDKFPPILCAKQILDEAKEGYEIF